MLHMTIRNKIKVTALLITFTLITVILFFPLLVTNVNAEANEEQSKKSDSSKPIENEGERKIGYSVSEDFLKVYSEGELKKRSNVFYFSLDLKKGLSLYFNYYRTPDSPEVEKYHIKRHQNDPYMDDKNLSSSLEKIKKEDSMLDDEGISLELIRLREFNQTDSEISTYKFSKSLFTKPLVKENLKNNEIDELEFTTSTKDGIFTLQFYVFSNYVNHTGLFVRPYEIKYNIIINNYPFYADDSMLALESNFSMPDFSSLPINKRLSDENLPEKEEFIKDIKNKKELWRERGVGYETNSSSMFFSWATNVTVDGTDYNVTAEYTGKIDGDIRNVETFTFIYPRGETIFHDPKIGVSDFLEYTEEKVTELIELILSWSSGVGAGLIVIVAIAIRKKPKKFDWED